MGDEHEPRLRLLPGGAAGSEPEPTGVERMLAAMAPGTDALRDAFAVDLDAMREAFSGPPPASPRRPRPGGAR